MNPYFFIPSNALNQISWLKGQFFHKFSINVVILFKTFLLKPLKPKLVNNKATYCPKIFFKNSICRQFFFKIGKIYDPKGAVTADFGSNL